MTCVCRNCFEDRELRRFVKHNAAAETCDYCGRTSQTPIAAELGDVLAFMREAIDKEFTDPANELPYETREGGYQGDFFDSPYDLFGEIDFYVDNERLFEDIAKAFWGDAWCRRGYFECTPTERRTFGWDRFKRVVKHARRFTFWDETDDGNDPWHPDHLPPSKMLDELAKVIRHAGVSIDSPRGTVVWRARVHDRKKRLNKPSDFASPPDHCAIYSNRMSPAGISMFYGASDPETAVREAVASEGKIGTKAVTVACFSTKTDMRLLDLTNIPKPPSFFSPRDNRRHSIYFLNSFARDIASRVVRDGREHIDYVPTQVFTEFIRFRKRTRRQRPYCGIKYRSTQAKGACFVLFLNHEDCLRIGDEQMLEFDRTSIKRFPARRFRTPRNATD